MIVTSSILRSDSHRQYYCVAFVIVCMKVQTYSQIFISKLLAAQNETRLQYGAEYLEQPGVSDPL